MIIRKNIIYFAFGVLPTILIAQAPNPDSSMTIPHFALEFGGGYSTFPLGVYIEPTKNPINNNIDEDQYCRFEKIPAFCFNAGIRWVLPFDQRWGVRMGIQYYHRNTEFERSQDTVVRYIAWPYNIRNINNIYRYHYSYNNIEIPVLFYYKMNRLKLSVGCNIAPLSYVVVNYKYVLNPKATNGWPKSDWVTASKTIYGLQLRFQAYAIAEMEYRLLFGQYEISPLFGLQYAINSQDELVLRVGFSFPLRKREYFTNTTKL